MTRRHILDFFVLTLALAGLVLSGGCRRSDGARPDDQGDRRAAAASPYDAETTDTARVLAGMSPLRPRAFAAVTGLQEWRDWESESRERWTAAWSDRVQPLRSWSDTALKDAASSCQSLLHPFGGTGFLAAYALFPSCEGYVLVGSEPVGQLPVLDDVTPAQVADYVEDMRRAFPEVFPARTGRRTSSGASAGPRLTGAIPSLLVQLARLDARIVSAARFDITTEGRPLESIPIRGGNARPAALSLTFEVPNGRPQSLVYFPADLDDASLRKRPGAWTFLRLQAPFATLLGPDAPAQAGRFSLLADLLRQQSRLILLAQPCAASLLGCGSLGPPDWTVSKPPPLPTPSFRRAAAPLLAIRR